MVVITRIEPKRVLEIKPEFRTLLMLVVKVTHFFVCGWPTAVKRCSESPPKASCAVKQYAIRSMLDIRKVIVVGCYVVPDLIHWIDDVFHTSPKTIRVLNLKTKKSFSIFTLYIYLLNFDSPHRLPNLTHHIIIILAVGSIPERRERSSNPFSARMPVAIIP